MGKPTSTSKAYPQTVHIYSDGHSNDTRIVLADGTELKDVINMRIDGEGGDPVRVTLEIMMPVVDVDGVLAEVIMRCPSCGHEDVHGCGSQ